MTSTKSYLLSILSGLLLALAFPPFDFSLVAWFALVPLLVAVVGGASNPFVAGLLAGGFFRSLTMYWIVPMLHGYAQASWVVSAGAFLLLVSYLSCYTAILAWAVRKITDCWGPVAALLAPIFWVALEYGNAHLFTGFYWNPLSASQSHHLRLVQISEFTGAYGVSFLVALVNAALFLLQSAWLPRRPRAGRRQAYAAAGVTAALLAGTFWWGEARLQAFQKQEEGAQTLHVRIVNPAVPQDVKWTLGHYGEALDQLAELSRGASKGTDLIVWPEAALPFYFEQNPFGARAVYDLSTKLQAPILFGAPGQRFDGDTVAFTNSAYLVTPNGEIAGRYDKERLVPFGEYVPLRPLVPFVPAVAKGLAAGDLSGGIEAEPMVLAGARLGLLICYEAIFPDIVRDRVDKGADLLINLSNDAWLGPAGAAQHFAMARLRAVEARVPLVRVANAGVTGVVSPAGGIVCGIDAGRPGAKTCTVARRRAAAGFRTLQALLPLLSVALSVAVLWVSLFVGESET